jgi:hypothetical protein
MTQKTAAFAFNRAKRTNIRWSWSALSVDGSVVLGLWRDEFGRP